MSPFRDGKVIILFRDLSRQDQVKELARIIECDESYSPAILAILNEAIISSTALYDYTPRSIESMAEWFANKRRGNLPVIGAVSDVGELMGFATYGTFRDKPAYKYTVEHSLYIAQNHRGQGIGKLLLRALIQRATQQDYHVMVGGIDSTNAASIALHQRFGFQHVATMKEVGFKFGRWLDLCFYQLQLDTPTRPVDG
jgi:L-amino acid N-acyltransferase